MDSKQIVELNVLMLALQNDVRDFRRENQALHEDLRMLKKVFAYKEQKVSSKEKRDAIMKKFKASVLLG